MVWRWRMTSRFCGYGWEGRPCRRGNWWSLVSLRPPALFIIRKSISWIIGYLPRGDNDSVPGICLRTASPWIPLSGNCTAEKTFGFNVFWNSILLLFVQNLIIQGKTLTPKQGSPRRKSTDVSKIEWTMFIVNNFVRGDNSKRFFDL